MRRLSFYFCVFLLLLTACHDRRKITRMDTMTSGVAEFVVDETLAPIIQSQVDVFESLNEEATIIPIFTSELEAYDQFVKDSVRLIIGARELTDNEKKIIEERKQRLRTQKLAVDAIAFITHKNNRDSLITVENLRKIFTGEVSNWNEIFPGSKLGAIDIAFDTPNSSMARYMKDSICAEKPFGANVKARSEDAKESVNINIEKTPNQRVIDYVSNTPNALGVIGVNWVSNPSDTTNLSFIDKIQVMAVSREEVATKENSYKPLPYHMLLKQYPMTRDIYIMITDVQGGLPAGFVHFSAGDKGQLIITKSGLLPATRPTRMVRVGDTW